MTIQRFPGTASAGTPFPLVANLERVFPRPHPSATTVLVFGGLSLVGLGPITGIPAIVLGGVVLRELKIGSKLYTGALSARIGLGLGWIGTLGYLGLALLLRARAAPSIGYVACVAGALVAAAAVVAERVGVRRRLQGALLPAVAVGATLAIGGLGGAQWHQRDEQAQVVLCTRLADNGAAALAAERFPDAKALLNKAEATCKGDPLRHAQALLSQLQQKEEEHRRAVVRAQFELERLGVQRLSEQVRDSMARQQWEAADVALSSANARLKPFEAHQDITGSQPWAEITGILTTERDRLSAPLDSLHRDRVASTLTESRMLAARGQWQAASDKLATTTELWHQFEPRGPTPFAADWKKLATDIEVEKTRIAPRLEALQRQREAAEEAERKRHEAREQQAERAAAAREASSRIACCDGTLSPSCLCSRSNRRGCCSHHGGICGCGD